MSEGKLAENDTSLLRIVNPCQPSGDIRRSPSLWSQSETTTASSTNSLPALFRGGIYLSTVKLLSSLVLIMACPSTQVIDNHGDYMREVWSWFAVGALAIILRLFVRIRTVGWRKLAGDDYLAPVVFVLIVMDMVTITLVYHYGSNLDYTEDKLRTLQPCQIDRIRLGSQMQLLAWYTYTASLWTLKFMILCFLHRMTFGLFQHRLVKLFALITALFYLAVFLTISCGCHPIRLNWQVLPLPPLKCTLKLQNFYVVAALNVSTDLLIMTIPIPLLWGMNVSVAKKIGLTLMLCSGIFLIIAAVIRISFSLIGLNAVNINKWGTRETVIGVLAVNAPMLRPMWNRSFWTGRRRVEDGEGGRTNEVSTIGSPRGFKKRLKSLFSTTDEERTTVTTTQTHEAQDGSSAMALADVGGLAKQTWDVEASPLPRTHNDSVVSSSNLPTIPLSVATTDQDQLRHPRSRGPVCPTCHRQLPLQSSPQAETESPEGDQEAIEVVR